MATALVGSLLGVGWAFGAAFGFLALIGNLASSFGKRRLGRASGADMPFLDQLPDALLPLLSLYGPLQLEPLSLVGTALILLVLLCSSRGRSTRSETTSRNEDARRGAMSVRSGNPAV